MKWLSIKDIAELYSVNSKSTQKALERGHLKGKKDINGCWRIEEEDVKNYYEEPSFPDWLPIKLCIFQYGLSKQKIIEAVEEGGLNGRHYRCGWYIHYFKLKENVLKMRSEETFSKIKEQVTITVLNKEGIHIRPASCIGRIVMDHPSAHIYMGFQGTCHSLSIPACSQVLLTLQIQKGDTILFKVKCRDKQEVHAILREILRAAENRFWVSH